MSKLSSIPLPLLIVALHTLKTADSFGTSILSARSGFQGNQIGRKEYYTCPAGQKTTSCIRAAAAAGTATKEDDSSASTSTATNGDSSSNSNNNVSPKSPTLSLSSKDEAEDAKNYLMWLTAGRRANDTNKSKEAESDKRSRKPSLNIGLFEESDSGQKQSSGVARFEGRYSASDWAHNAWTLKSSTVLREILNPVLCMSFWGVFISVLHRIFLNRGMTNFARHMCISSTPHSLMVSALSLLLVFRTNSAYQRFAEGRKIWERILTHSRDLSRMMILYEQQIGTEKRRRVQRLLAAFPYLLRHRIRPNLGMRRLKDNPEERDPENTILLYDDSALFDDDAQAASVASDEEEKGTSRRKTRELFWVDKRTLPWRLLPGQALAGCARAQNRPLWVCDRMAKELVSTPDQIGFTNRERLLLLSHIDKISHAIGECERIHQTVVPLNYARHCLRGVTLWLLSLPFALVSQLGLLTGPVLSIMSWLLYGIYQIGYNIEDPFQSTLRLSILCDAIRRDVFADEILMRDTAFVLDDEFEKAQEDEDEDFVYESESSLIDDDEIMAEDAGSEANVEGENIETPTLAIDPQSGRQVLEIANVSLPDNTAIVADEGIVGGNKTEIMSLKPFE
mmetsp:Transcript_18669/g.28982  ORF Transcript_18669/g.28982 Transcript_18669/m.28982 type:complete len:622 (-) Transcript_18669:119-1984(-)